MSIVVDTIGHRAKHLAGSLVTLVGYQIYLTPRLDVQGEIFGHEAGNNLLNQVGERLSAIIRGSDIISWTGTDTPGHKLLPVDTRTEYRATLARLGGDEFGMLLPSVETEQQATAVARRIINSLSAEYTINDQQVTLQCCIGISMYPDHGQQEQELIRNADKAMFSARQSGSRYCIYSTKKL